MLAWQVGKAIPEGVGMQRTVSQVAGGLEWGSQGGLAVLSWTCYITGHIHTLNKNSWVKFPLTGHIEKRKVNGGGLMSK